MKTTNAASTYTHNHSREIDERFLDQEFEHPEFDPGAEIETRQDFRHIAGQVVVATILGLDWRPVEGDEFEDPGADVAYGCPGWMGYERAGWREVMVFRAGVFASVLLTPSGEISGQEPEFEWADAGPGEFPAFGIHQMDRRSQQDLAALLRRLAPVMREVIRLLRVQNGEIHKPDVQELLTSMAHGSVQS